MARFKEFPFYSSLKTDLISHTKIFIALLLVAALQLPLSSTVFAEPENPKLANDRCLRCHGKENYSRKTASGEEQIGRASCRERV